MNKMINPKNSPPIFELIQKGVKFGNKVEKFDGDQPVATDCTMIGVCTMKQSR